MLELLITLSICRVSYSCNGRCLLFSHCLILFYSKYYCTSLPLLLHSYNPFTYPRSFIVLYADDILLIAPSINELQSLFRNCEKELV